MKLVWPKRIEKIKSKLQNPYRYKKNKILLFGYHRELKGEKNPNQNTPQLLQNSGRIDSQSEIIGKLMPSWVFLSLNLFTGKTVPNVWHVDTSAVPIFHT